MTALVQDADKQNPQEKGRIPGQQNDRQHRRKAEVYGDLQLAETYFHRLPAREMSWSVHGRSGALLRSRNVSVTEV